MVVCASIPRSSQGKNACPRDLDCAEGLPWPAGVLILGQASDCPQYGYSNKSQIQLEKKEDMKSRGLASPDLGDTLAMTFHVNVNAKLREQKEWFEQYQRYRYKNDTSADAWMA